MTSFLYTEKDNTHLGKDCTIQIVYIFRIAKSAIFVQEVCMVYTWEQDSEA